MNILLFFIGICVYTMIGSFIAPIVDWDDNSDAVVAMAMFWPIIVPVLIIVKLASLSLSASGFLVRSYYEFKIKRRNKR